MPQLNQTLLQHVAVPQRERRISRRISVSFQQKLRVVIRCGQGLVCQGCVLNISLQGMLVAFPDDQIPAVPPNGKVSIKLICQGDSIWLPGLVRHRKGKKMGFLLPPLKKNSSSMAKRPLNVVLEALAHANRVL